jgi:excisionase family DNA binding protein
VLHKKAAAAYLGIGIRTLERLIRREEVPVIKLKRWVLIRKTALDEFLESKERRRARGEGESKMVGQGVRVSRGWASSWLLRSPALPCPSPTRRERTNWLRVLGTTERSQVDQYIR